MSFHLWHRRKDRAHRTLTKPGQCGNFRPRIEVLESRLVLTSGLDTASLTSFIVVLNEQVTSAPDIAHQLVEHYQGELGHVFEHALKGFSARLSADAAQELRNDPRVLAVEADAVLYAAAQILPSGVDRIDVDQNTTADIDGVHVELNVDIAIIDTGIDRDHPDLNISGGRNFARTFTQIIFGIPADPNAWDDNNGHGTHVAGTAAAMDNDMGVVGVAPGARLWGVKVLGADGAGYMADIIAGVDWVTSTRTDADPTNDIDVANMSLAGSGTDSSALRAAIRRSVAAGIVYVVAAGNSSQDIYGADHVYGTIDDVFPAAFPEVMTISALTDTDGQPGGLGASASYGGQDRNGDGVDDGRDDTLAWFSNYASKQATDINAANGVSVSSSGGGIDLMLPGVDIYSTYPDRTYDQISGTSMASPHAAGLAALYIAQTAPATDAFGVYAIRQALINAGWTQDSFEGLAVQNDRDGTSVLANQQHENIGSALFSPGEEVPVHDVAISSIGAPASATQGQTIQVSVIVRNMGTDEAGPFSVSLTDATDGILIDTISLASLARGESRTLSFSWNTSAEALGDHTLVASHDLVDDASANNSASRIVTIQAPAPPPTDEILYFSVQQTWQLPGTTVTADNDDIVAYNRRTDSFSLYFNGTPWLTDIGGSLTIDALAIKSDTEILLSFAEDGGVYQTNGDALFIDNSDIVLFRHASGNTSAGTFEIFFDGSLYGLTGAEDVDGIELLENGDLLLSTLRNFSVSSASGSTISGAGEDILRFSRPTSDGKHTTPGGHTWSVYFDGSNRGLTTSRNKYAENVDALAFYGDKLYLSTEGNFSASANSTSVSGQDEDVFLFVPGTQKYAGTYFDGTLSKYGLSNHDIGGIDVALGGGMVITAGAASQRFATAGVRASSVDSSADGGQRSFLADLDAVFEWTAKTQSIAYPANVVSSNHGWRRAAADSPTLDRMFEAEVAERKDVSHEQLVSQGKPSQELWDRLFEEMVAGA